MGVVTGCGGSTIAGHRHEDLPEPPQRGPARLEDRQHPADHLHRSREEPQIGDELDDLADGHLAADGFLAADVDGGEDRDAQHGLHHRPQQVRDLREVERPPQVAAIERRECLDLRRLLAEGLDDANARQVLLGRGREVAELGLQTPEQVVDAPPDDDEREAREGQHDQREERQADVDRQHRRDGEDQGRDRRGEVEEAAREHRPDGVQVVGQAGHEVADPLMLVIAEVHPLQMREQVVAHLVLDVATVPDGEQATDRLEQDLEARDGHDQPREREDDADVVPAAELVDRTADEARRDRRDEGARPGREQAEGQSSLVAPDVREEELPRGHRTELTPFSGGVPPGPRWVTIPVAAPPMGQGGGPGAPGGAQCGRPPNWGVTPPSSKTAVVGSSSSPRAGGVFLFRAAQYLGAPPPHPGGPPPGPPRSSPHPRRVRQRTRLSRPWGALAFMPRRGAAPLRAGHPRRSTSRPGGCTRRRGRDRGPGRRRCPAGKITPSSNAAACTSRAARPSRR